MTDLLDLVIARLQSLTAGQEFDDPETDGATIPLRIEKGFLPPKRGSAAQGEDFPFIICRLMGGREQQRQGRITVRLIAGIHTNGDKDAGQADIITLLELLLQTIDQRTYTPYHLEPEEVWYFGDPDDGIQPHPKYYVTVDMTFKRQPTATNRR